MRSTTVGLFVLFATTVALGAEPAVLRVDLVGLDVVSQPSKGERVGTRVTLLVRGEGVFGIDDGAPSLTLEDDKGTRLSAGLAVGALVCPGEDAALVEVATDARPSPGARSIHVAGTLNVLTPGRVERRTETIEVAPGNTIPGVVPLRVAGVHEAKPGAYWWASEIKLEASSSLSWLLNLEVNDPSGARVHSSLGPRLHGAGATESQILYVEKKLDHATFVMDVRSRRVVALPVKLDIGLPVLTPERADSDVALAATHLSWNQILHRRFGEPAPPTGVSFAFVSSSSIDRASSRVTHAGDDCGRDLLVAGTFDEPFGVGKGVEGWEEKGDIVSFRLREPSLRARALHAEATVAVMTDAAKVAVPFKLDMALPGPSDTELPSAVLGFHLDAKARPKTPALEVAVLVTRDEIGEIDMPRCRLAALKDDRGTDLTVGEDGRRAYLALQGIEAHGAQALVNVVAPRGPAPSATRAHVEGTIDVLTAVEGASGETRETTLAFERGAQLAVGPDPITLTEVRDAAKTSPKYPFQLTLTSRAGWFWVKSVAARDASGAAVPCTGQPGGARTDPVTGERSCDYSVLFQKPIDRATLVFTWKKLVRESVPFCADLPIGLAVRGGAPRVRVGPGSLTVVWRQPPHSPALSRAYGRFSYQRESTGMVIVPAFVDPVFEVDAAAVSAAAKDDQGTVYPVTPAQGDGFDLPFPLERDARTLHLEATVAAILTTARTEKKRFPIAFEKDARVEGAPLPLVVTEIASLRGGLCGVDLRCEGSLRWLNGASVKVLDAQGKPVLASLARIDSHMDGSATLGFVLKHKLDRGTIELEIRELETVSVPMTVEVGGVP